MNNQTYSLSRRGFARALLASTTLCAIGGARALAAPTGGNFGNQAEWEQKYDSTAAVLVRTTTPILSPQTVAMTEAAIAQYRELVAQGGWQGVPSAQTMKIGSKGPAVTALRRRLAVTGDLTDNAGQSTVFDSFVQGGVMRFQSRHGINPTGDCTKETLAALNVSAQDRLRSLELNLTRLRSYAGNLGARYITLNIPAAAVETVENGEVFSHHAGGVGKIDRQSPVMQAKVLDINFNPFWTVPASIIRKDLIPRMQEDPGYLADHKIRVIDKGGQEVAPTTINWNSMDATNYRFRQDPGADINSLGAVRVNIANQYGVYMHDTPEKGVFGDDYRFVSSGCVRVQNIRDYVAWILKDTPGWDRDHIDEAIRSGARIDAKLTQTIPVYWVYITAWANDGIVQFRDDIYKRDGGGDALAFSEGVTPSSGAPMPDGLEGKPVSAKRAPARNASSAAQAN